MWLSEQAVRLPEREKDAQIAVVTIGGESPAARTDQELRGLLVTAPGGYVWLPQAEAEVLTLSCGTGETVVAGQRQLQVPAGMEPGEVYLYSASGASVLLKNSGQILLSGDVDVQGALTVNGVPVMLGL